MLLAYWCILIAGLLPFVFAYIAKFSSSEQFNNRNPREWLARQTGLQARAHAAQLNSFETLPLFIAGVLVAGLQAAPHLWLNGLAIGYVLARVAFGACYCLDKPTLRSISWIIGMACTIGLFIVAA